MRPLAPSIVALRARAPPVAAAVVGAVAGAVAAATVAAPLTAIVAGRAIAPVAALAVGSLAARPPRAIATAAAAGARCWTTGSNGTSLGSSSSIPARSPFSFGGTTDRTRIPSMSFSDSTRS